MFVSRSKYNNVLKQRNKSQTEAVLLATQVITLSTEFKSLREKWEELVTKVNSKGGEAFLNHGELYGFNKSETQFTNEELKVLRRLVHPDKHGNSVSANNLTAKINQLVTK